MTGPAPKLRGWLRSRAPALAVGLAFLAAAAWFSPRLLMGPEVAVGVVTQADFTQTVVATGRVESPHRVSIGSQIVGTVAEVPVAEGERVVAGTPLIRLDSAELRAADEQAGFALRVAQARVRAVREVELPAAEQALKQAQANHETAARALRRSVDLFERKFIGEAALDDAVRAEQVAMAQMRTAQKQLAGVSPGGSGAMSAEAGLAQARAAAAMTHARLGYAVITAPASGVLISRDVERGDVVQPGKTLMSLSPDGETQLVLQIDEKNLKLLETGQAALASADAYPELRFAARLSYINPAVDAQRGSVEVKLQVPQPPDYLRQDMTVSVDIEVAKRPAALLVPAEAVRDIDSASPWVLRVEDGRAHRRAVKVGLHSRGWCEIAGGVRAGDLVIVAAPSAKTAIADGSRVRAREPQRS